MSKPGWTPYPDGLYPGWVQRVLDTPQPTRAAWLYAYWKAFGRAKANLILEPVNLYLEGSFDMARGKSNASSGKGPAQWTTFVDISIAGHKQQDIVKAFPSADTIDQGVVSLLEKGYRISLSYNSQTDAFICSITCKADGSPNNGKTFNAFAGDWAFALQCALYKHFVVAKEIWGEGASDTPKPSFG